MTRGGIRSLTLRLTLLFGAASTVVLVLIGYAFYVSLDRHFLHEDAIELRGKVELVRSLVGRMRSETDRMALTARLQDALIGHDNLALSLVTPNGTTLYSETGTTFGLPSVADAPAGTLQAIGGLMIDSVALSGHHYRVTRFPVSVAQPDGPAQLSATLAMNVDHHRQFMARVRDSTLALVIAGAVAAALLGFVVARVGLAPVRAFSELTSRITADRLDTRIAIPELPPELAPLGESFNAMLARLEESFQRLSNFSSDLAHELRTPISVLMTQSQVALSRSRSTEEYREVLYSAVEEYERLARMIGDMLFLAKADNGLLVPAREAIDLRAEIGALFDFYDALVESKAIKLEATGAGIVDGDRIMIRRALGNLLSNAIRHAPRGSTIGADIAQHGNEVSLALTNEGDPIPDEHLPRLFDRFYRVDPSRERSSGDGAGLGLAITRTIVAALHGTIRVTSNRTGTRFDIRLPSAHMKYPAEVDDESRPRTIL
jgi:two-component system heavy metal sensor histidine kinase CusS